MAARSNVLHGITNRDAYQQFYEYQFRTHPPLRVAPIRKRVREQHCVIGANETHQLLALGVKTTTFCGVIDELDPARCALLQATCPDAKMGSLLGGILVLHPTNNSVQHRKIFDGAVGLVNTHHAALHFEGPQRNVWLIGRLLLVCVPDRYGEGLILSGARLDEHGNWVPFHQYASSRCVANAAFFAHNLTFAYHAPRWWLIRSGSNQLALDLDEVLYQQRSTFRACPNAADLATIDVPLAPRPTHRGEYPMYCVRCGDETVSGYLEVAEGNGSTLCCGLGLGTCARCRICYSKSARAWRCFRVCGDKPCWGRAAGDSAPCNPRDTEEETPCSGRNDAPPHESEIPLCTCSMTAVGTLPSPEQLELARRTYEQVHMNFYERSTRLPSTP